MASSRTSSKSSVAEVNNAGQAALEGAEGETGAWESEGPVPKPWESWVFLHEPSSPIPWRKTLNRNSDPSSSSDPGEKILSEQGRRKGLRFVSMTNTEMDAHFANDWGMKLGLEFHRSQVRKRLGRSTSSPSSLAGSKPPTPSTPPATASKDMLTRPETSVGFGLRPLPVSAWQLWGKPGKVITPWRQDETTINHFNVPRLERCPGEYCHRYMKTEQWSPRYGVFHSAGGHRTKCSVSELDRSWRWQYRDGLRTRLSGTQFMDGYSRLTPSCGI